MTTRGNRSLFFTVLPDLLCIATPDGSFVEVNDQWEELLGFDTATLMATPYLELVHPDDLERTREVLEKLAQGEKVTNFVARLRTAKNSYVPLSWNAGRDPNSSLLYVVGRDLTAEFMAERRRRVTSRMLSVRTAELRASEERFQNLFDMAPQAMLLLDSTGHVASSNERARTLFGFPEDELNGMSVSNLFPPEHQHASTEGLASALARVSSRRTNTDTFSLAGKRRDDTRFRAEIGLVPIVHRGKQHTIAGVSNVTARVNALNAVQVSLREKETLLREIHHRVKNNLQIISSLLNMQFLHADEDSVRAPLQESMQRIQSMALVHQQLYGMESLERIDLKHYSENLIGFLRSSLAPSSRFRIEADSIQVGIDVAVPFGLILNELVTNAMKYGIKSDRSGDSADNEDDLVVMLSVDGLQISLSVNDRGPGLPDEVHRKPQSSLGLKLVHALVKQLSGRLTYAYEDGSRFKIKFTDST